MTNPLHELLKAGESVWLDNLRRSMFASGELQRLIDRGLRGMTSNPTIFEKAIASGDDYDAQLRELIAVDRDPATLFWELAVTDIRSACDAFAPVYAASQGNDGFVSLEVSPLLAADTKGTIAMAQELWHRVERPNLMVKIPGTTEGVAAIEECIYLGLNINVTLIFAVEMYEATARAYIRGLERRIADGNSVDRIRSVNSVFVSRIDSAVDKLLDAGASTDPAQKALLGKAGVANLKLTYAKFRELFFGDAFAKARAAGAAMQRPLWASTSTKNPAYPDLLYVERVVARDTVNTMPPNTIDALFDHGVIVPDTIDADLPGVHATMQGLAAAGVDFAEVTQQLQVEGVRSFAASFDTLLAAIAEKRDRLAVDAKPAPFLLGTYRGRVDMALQTLTQQDILQRLMAKDATLWSSDPAHLEIITHALGWLDIAQRMRKQVPALVAFAEQARGEFDHVVVLGMGGSSLAPDVLHDTFGRIAGFPELHVLDSTDPQQIAELQAQLDLKRSLFIVASKSGTTTEPDAFYRYFHQRVVENVGKERAMQHFVAITDPGTALAKEAAALSFRACFENDPNIGGRYSALSYVGALPAALAGYDIATLLDRAIGAMAANAASVDPISAPGVRFGAALGALAIAGRDKLTIVTHPSIRSYGSWCEQLIAESTGKLGKGIIPIEGESLGAPEVYGNDRVFVFVGAGLPGADAATASQLEALAQAGHPVLHLAMRDISDIGAQFFLWEIATATAGVLLGIDAFDQPNVQESKENTKALLAQFAGSGRIPLPAVQAQDDRFAMTLLPGSASASHASVLGALGDVLAELHADDYLTFSAYIARNKQDEKLLHELRQHLRDRCHVATTVGFGPRFLHSTGQLHKGGPDSVVTLQILHAPQGDPAIPGMNVGFGTLIAAQALGDWQSLAKRNRRGLRITIKGELTDGLKALRALIDDALAAKA